MLRVVFSAAASCVLSVAGIGSAIAQEPASSPTGTSSCRPSVTAQTPIVGTEYGIGGHVVVEVGLDSTGSIVSTRAAGWSSKVFVPAALSIARQSTFAATVHNCASVRGTFDFNVDFPVPSHLPALRVDPVAYLPGTWRCGVGFEQSRTLVFARDGDGLDLSDGATTTSAIPDRYRMWRIRRDGALVAWAYPWVDDEWVWSSQHTQDPSWRFRRIDEVTFALTTRQSPSVAERTERCTLVPKTPSS